MNGMTLIVKTITRLVLGFIVILSASTILYGHITPGGGFAGGVMIACGFILLVLAFGKNTVLDMFMGSGTTGMASKGTKRNFIGCDLDENYAKLAESWVTGMGEEKIEETWNGVADGNSPGPLEALF